MMQLELKDLTKQYGKFIALNQFSCIFETGIYGILGANGAGKSTLMNLITDNLRRDSGSILFEGTEILKMGKDWRMRVGYMPQQQGFYEHMTADSFLFYMAELKGIKKAQAKEDINNLLEVVNLSEVRHKKIGGYSGGMKQRILLVQAMLGNPQVVILDEPTAGLDPKERIRIRNFISTMSRNRIVLLATHIVSDIESIADKIIMMKKGSLVKIGSPEELLDSIADKVYEIPICPENADELQNKYRIGNISSRHGQMIARMVGDDLPEKGCLIPEHLTLEDVYLYYLGE